MGNTKAQPNEVWLANVHRRNGVIVEVLGYSKERKAYGVKILASGNASVNLYYAGAYFFCPTRKLITKAQRSELDNYQQYKQTCKKEALDGLKTYLKSADSKVSMETLKLFYPIRAINKGSGNRLPATLNYIAYHTPVNEYKLLYEKLCNTKEGAYENALVLLDDVQYTRYKHKTQDFDGRL